MGRGSLTVVARGGFADFVGPPLFELEINSPGDYRDAPDCFFSTHVISPASMIVSSKLQADPERGIVKRDDGIRMDVIEDANQDTGPVVWDIWVLMHDA